MKRKNLLLVTLMSLTFPLVSCGGGTEEIKPSEKPTETPKDVKISLEDFQKILEGRSYGLEVEESVTSKHKATIDNNGKTEITNESGFFYNDEVSFFIGDKTRTYKNGDPSDTDTYTKVAETVVHDIISTGEKQKVFYLATDYEKEEFEYTKDTAYRIPVVKKATQGTSGVDYLLENELPGQLSKQVTLLVDTFIRSNLTNNINLSGYKLKDVVVKEEKDTFVYTFDALGYSYTDEDIDTHVEIDFEVVTSKDNKLLTAWTSLTTTETRGNDKYTNVLKDEYELTYGTRKDSSTHTQNKINALDYFLTEIKGVGATYVEGTKTLTADLNNLPLGKYIHFKASDFVPAKAIDTKLFVQKIENDTNSAFLKDGNVLKVVKSGECDITLVSESGVTFKTHLKTESPDAKTIDLDDTYSGLVKLDSGVRKADEGTTYKSNNLIVKPVGANLDDIGIKVSDPNLVKVEEVKRVASRSIIEYKLTFGNVTKDTNVTIEFYSKKNPNIKIVREYTVCNTFTIEELKQDIIGKTFSWKNIYTYIAYEIKFTSATEGRYISYESNDTTKERFNVPFTFEIKGNVDTNYGFVMTLPADFKGDYVFDFTKSYISKDGTCIGLDEPEQYRVQKFKRK